MRSVGLAIVVISLLAGACAGDDEPTGPYTAGVLVEGLNRPTQLVVTDDAWYVAQLNGGEESGIGEVLRLDPRDLDAEPVVVFDGLDKPTGLAFFDGDLWVMEERTLSRGPVTGGYRPIVVDDMASNGRSQGTLTVDGDRLLFDTSGSTRIGTGPGGTPSDTSGALWAIDADGNIENIGWGFKHAYAHVRDSDGVLWTTKMSDGSYDGVAAADEIVAVVEGANHGWPACVDDNRAVLESGVAEPCDGVPGSQITFAPGATPTGLAIAPWDPSQLVVALWVEQRIVALSADPADAMRGTELVTDALQRPHHLVADGDRLLVTDHEAGTIVAITKN